MQIPFVGPTYEGRSKNFDASRCINLFPELAVDQNERSPGSLIGTPGILEFTDFPDLTETRLMYNFADRLFVVVDTNIYEIDSDGVQDFRVNGVAGTGRVIAADNGVAALGVGGDQILLVTSTTGYVYNVSTNTLTAITDAGFPANPNSVTYQDGYFIVTAEDSMTFYVSELYNGLVWPGLAFASVIATPDPIKRAISLNQRLFFIKKWSTEAWYNTGTPTSQGSPFSRVSGVVLGFGTSAPYSVAYGADTIFFIGNIGHGNSSEFAGVMMLDGYTPTVISTAPLNYRITKMTRIDDAIGYTYYDEGHLFYVLTFPTEDVTLVYDAMTKLWHERSTNFETDAPFVTRRHASNGYVYFNDKHYVSDYRAATIHEMSSDYYNDNGQNIISIRTFQPLANKQDTTSIFISKLSVDCEGGVGDNTVAPSDPMYTIFADGVYFADGTQFAGGYDLISSSNGNPNAWLSWSNDGGHTWSNEYPDSLGKMGEYKKRLVWRRLGYARNRVFRLRVVASVKKVLMGAYINAT